MPFVRVNAPVVVKASVQSQVPPTPLNASGTGYVLPADVTLFVPDVEPKVIGPVNTDELVNPLIELVKIKLP